RLPQPAPVVFLPFRAPKQGRPKSERGTRKKSRERGRAREKRIAMSAETEKSAAAPAPAPAPMRCQRIGCDAMFTDDDNPDGSCHYHPSVSSLLPRPLPLEKIASFRSFELL
uniref:Uncharacterized protein n=1 Tax=Aegilops tauschii subsp. strangulata TaxID=200361 RepID=A0A453CPZ2_AEGTS